MKFFCLYQQPLTQHKYENGMQVKDVALLIYDPDPPAKKRV
jgi:hypothetical protein